MDMSFEDQIRERAYQIWQAGGMADGQAHEHWISAEKAMRGEVVAVSAEPEVILTKAKSTEAKSTEAKPRKASAKAPTAKAVSPRKAATKSAAAPKASRTRKAAPAAQPAL